jgi:hypothetical protein
MLHNLLHRRRFPESMLVVGPKTNTARAVFTQTEAAARFVDSVRRKQKASSSEQRSARDGVDGAPFNDGLP